MITIDGICERQIKHALKQKTEIRAKMGVALNDSDRALIADLKRDLKHLNTTIALNTERAIELMETQS